MLKEQTFKDEQSTLTTNTRSSVVNPNPHTRLLSTNNMIYLILDNGHDSPCDAPYFIINEPVLGRGISYSHAIQILSDSGCLMFDHNFHLCGALNDVPVFVVR